MHILKEKNLYEEEHKMNQTDNNYIVQETNKKMTR